MKSILKLSFILFLTSCASYNYVYAKIIKHSGSKKNIQLLLQIKKSGVKNHTEKKTGSHLKIEKGKNH